MTENQYIDDSEELYRNIRARSQGYKHYILRAGRIEIKYGAFHDSSQRPSVDRAKSLNCDPRRALFYDKNGIATNGIITLLAGDIREIGEKEEVKTETTDESIVHTVDIIFCPDYERERYAHCEIIVDPDFFEFDAELNEEDPFRLLQKALARLATISVRQTGWTLAPQER